jgi:protein arginine kinase activator
MLCDECHKNKALFQLTDIKNNQKVGERHLCLSCAQKLGLAVSPSPVAVELVAQVTAQAQKAGEPKEEDVPAVTCEVCGMSLFEFQKEGRLGCANDYKAFSEHIGPMLERYHHATRHVGKVPRGAGADAAREAAVRSLREQLNAAVGREDYEEAARLRDALAKALGQKDAEAAPTEGTQA